MIRFGAVVVTWCVAYFVGRRRGEATVDALVELEAEELVRQRLPMS